MNLKRMRQVVWPQKPKTPGDGDILWKQEFSEALSISESVELARKAVFEVKEPSMKAAKTMCRRSWDKEGPSHEMRNMARKALAAFRGKPDKQVEYLRILKAAISLEASDINGSHLQARTVLRADEQSQMRMPAALIGALHQGDLLKTTWSSLCVQALARASEAERSLFELFADTSKSICIVGNSPCETGRKSGKKIDEHDIVIRFNNYEATSDFAEDYGRKTTIWTRARGNVDMWRRPYSAFSHVLFSGPDLRYHAATAYDIVDCYNENGNAAFVPARIYSQLTQALDAQPSAGLAIAYWVRQFRGAPDGQGFSIFGMALDDQEPTKPSHYFANHLKRSAYAHNWSAEARFFRSKILQNHRPSAG